MEYQFAFKVGDYMTDEEFFRFCQMNDSLEFERNADGQILIMAPTSSKTGIYNLIIGSVLYLWNEEHKYGYAFDSSTGFKLPNTAVRSPDVSWVEKHRWESLTASEKDSFAPLCPDFVVEIKSKSDDLNTLKSKMLEYIDNGSKLGWLFDLDAQKVYIYRPQKEVEEVPDFQQTLSGENVLVNFSLDLKRLAL